MFFKRASIYQNIIVDILKKTIWEIGCDCYVPFYKFYIIFWVSLVLKHILNTFFLHFLKKQIFAWGKTGQFFFRYLTNGANLDTLHTGC